MTVPRCHLSTGIFLYKSVLSLKLWCTHSPMFINAIDLGNAR
jgi:hypothetical protein